MTRLKSALLGAALLLAPVMAQAQNNYPSVGGATVPTSVAMCLNSSGQAVPLFNASGTWQCAGATIPVSGTVTVDTSLLATAAKQDTQTTQQTAINTLLGLQADAACATDNGTCTLEALVKRLNQRVTTVNTTLGTPFQAGGSIGNTTFGATLNTTPTDANGNGVVINPSTEALAGIVPVVSASLESNHVICAAACNFYGGYITTGGTAGWLLLANATSAPTAGGAAIAPIACILAPANQTTSISGPPAAPIRGSTGIVMVFSTSGCLTNTASTTAYFSGQAK